MVPFPEASAKPWGLNSPVELGAHFWNACNGKQRGIKHLTNPGLARVYGVRRWGWGGDSVQPRPHGAKRGAFGTEIGETAEGRKQAGWQGSGSKSEKGHVRLH